MKKIILPIIIIIILYDISANAYIAKKIDLQLKDNETSIVFLRLHTSTSILINDEENSNLFILDYKNDKDLKKVLKIFNSTPDIFYLNKKTEKKVDNIYVFYQNNTLTFRINNYNLCVYNKQNTNNCDFIYILNLNKTFEINNNTSAIFYDYKINDKYLKNVNESWIDSSIVSTDSFTILKLNEDSYNIVIVPSTNN